MEVRMKYCPLWSIVFQTTGKKPCMGKECGMYGLCNPFDEQEKEKEKKEEKLKVFGGEQ